MYSRVSTGCQSPNRDIDKLDFDDHRKPQSAKDSDDDEPGRSDRGVPGDDERLLGNVVDSVVEIDRRKLRHAIAKYISFAGAVLCW